MSQWESDIQRKFFRPSRLKAMIKFLNKLPGGTILDIGCMDDELLKILPKRFDYTGIDKEPLIKHPKIIKGSIEKNLPKNKKYDIVICTEVLEHVVDPPDLIRKIKTLSKRFILISVPNEPYFSLVRAFGFLPGYEHLWTIFPWAFLPYLGKPVCSATPCFRRSYLALWDKKSPNFPKN